MVSDTMHKPRRPDEGHWLRDLDPVRDDPGQWYVYEGYGSVAAPLRAGIIKRPDTDLIGTGKDPWSFRNRSGDLWVRYDTQ